MWALRGLILLALLLVPVQLQRVTTPRAAPSRSAPPLTLMRGEIPRDTPLAVVLAAHLPQLAIHQIVEGARPLYDLSRILPGHPFGLVVGADGLLQAFTYSIDELRTLRVTRTTDGLRPEIVAREYDTRVVTRQGAIRSSLFASIEAIGEDDQLALDLADIFAWDVDFNTEIQMGDSFRVAVEKQYLDGSFRRYGRILAAKLTRGPRTLTAVRFESRSGSGYYAPDGRPLRKAFLRSPLRFTRISSGFSSGRFHPILKTVTAHRGIDYAAPAGTPVHASADGRVMAAGWLGGYGRTVRIRHANGFETLYGHLSAIRVRAGQHVAQGDCVGAVGSTGLSTGPHLDYRMWRDGRPANPLRIQLPPAPPVAEAERAAFAAECRRAVALLDHSRSAHAGPGAPSR